PWTVVHARATPAAPDTPSAASALGAALGSALVDTDGATVRILTDREVTPQPGWTLGTSTPKAPTDLATANTEAAHALAHAVATRKPLVHHATMNVGEAWGLSTLLPQPEARAHARTLLAPLTGPLPETLRCWLSLHGSWDRTATTLSVHRNTVRQRIARCATLLNADLNDMDVRAELWLALRTR
ncbi:helix-turn-helix domain-containing protein, partial [Streptomyces sp. 150FB]|uniref:PucR family transcriptional regulator n=1 Tax=Streptomyces sp. 150FB TaxID=1576605 RepID=UPI001237675C